MPDEFDRFLSKSLEVEPGGADRAFVARVQARIALDERLRVQRRSVLRELGGEVLALAAIAVGLVWFGRAAPVDQFFVESPAAALAVLLSGFALLIVAFTSQTNSFGLSKIDLRTNSNT